MAQTFKQNMLRRAAMLLLVMVLGYAAAWAGDVTPEQAKQQAQKFLKSRKNNSGGPLYAPGKSPSLTLRSQVSGLYVFNVENNGGFVIVSNDDRAVPILGYSDSGAFDPDQMPDNMRAWLQGYADEIAWMKAHSGQTEPFNGSRAGSNRAAKTPIEPMITTRWNQGAPYNNLTPYYKKDGSNIYYSKDALSGYSHCVTGCVATAMAQVMKFHEWPTAACTAIPFYAWESAGINLPELPAKTFDWANMLNSYSGSETATQQTAVATLMQYCGYSVEMDYGPESGSNTYKVADALKAYFDYNSTTTQCVQRSFYTYANWIELIYHELANGRPVVYGGQSMGGGHEFVCDGYQGEDYFHINWGWGGLSDNYFKLSALDPDAQGIGGSSSEDGYHYGQEAVIGIQPSTGTGTVLPVTPYEVGLTLNGVTFSASPTQYEEVTVNIDVKNNKSYAYDGDIGIRLYYKDGGTWYDVDDIGSSFLIPANSASTVCQLKFTPKYSGTYGVKVYRPYETPGLIIWIKNETYNVDVAPGTGNPNLSLTFDTPTINNPLDITAVYPKIRANIYGTRLSGSLKIKNENGSAYIGSVGWELHDSEDHYLRGNDINNVTIPAGETREVLLDLAGLTVGETYILFGLWTEGSSWNYDYVYFTVKPAITTYATDGTETFTKPSGTSYTALANALVVDVSGTGITSITPNTQPNAIYIYSGTKPTGLDGKNVVQQLGESYEAESISLTDGYDFFTPVNIESGSIEFTYNFTVGADGTNGWNTLMLPFEAECVTADGTDIAWFHSSTDTGKNFWLKKFVNDDATHVYFDYEEDFAVKPNTPYIVAFPGDHWGAAWDLSAKEIKFTGAGTIHKNDAFSSVTGANYRFIGSTMQNNTANIYCLNASGNKFELKETGGSGPFRAYFKPGTFDSSITSLGIGSGDATSISLPTINDQRSTINSGWYTLNGMRLNSKPTTQGVYIHNGKKIVIK